VSEREHEILKLGKEVYKGARAK